jgi:hypothetical protein
MSGFLFQRRALIGWLVVALFFIGSSVLALLGRTPVVPQRGPVLLTVGAGIFMALVVLSLLEATNWIPRTALALLLLDTAHKVLMVWANVQSRTWQFYDNLLTLVTWVALFALFCVLLRAGNGDSKSILV